MYLFQAGVEIEEEAEKKDQKEDGYYFLINFIYRIIIK